MATVLEINRELADRLYDEARRNPQSPYAGRKVGIANGQVVVVADDWDDVAQALRQADPDPMRTFCIDLAQDYDSVQVIWRI